MTDEKCLDLGANFWGMRKDCRLQRKGKTKNLSCNFANVEYDKCIFTS